jgi:hypothetical protein
MGKETNMNTSTNQNSYLWATERSYEDGSWSPISDIGAVNLGPLTEDEAREISEMVHQTLEGWKEQSDCDEIQGTACYVDDESTPSDLKFEYIYIYLPHKILTSRRDTSPLINYFTPAHRTTITTVFVSLN